MSWFTAHSPRLPLGSYGPFYFRRKLSLSPVQAATHMHVMGKSGSGKSRFLAHWYVSLLKAGQAATLVDPHGDTARLVLAHLLHAGYFQEPNAYERLWYLDIPTAARRKRYLPFNLLAQGLEPTTIASNFKEAMHRAFPELAHGAATFDTLLPRAIRVLLHHQLPVTQLEPFLLDKAFRSQLLTTFPDANVVLYFRQLEKLRESDHFNYIGSVLRRAQQLSDLPVLRHSLAASANRIDFRKVMDSGTSLLINLAVQEDEAARLLGCLLTVLAEQGAKSRGAIAEDTRGQPHWLFLDEFANFTAQSEQALSSMLSQTRKFGLFVVLANQTWSQTSLHLKGSLQNVGIEVSFKLGREDAEHSSRIFGQVTPLEIKHEVEDEQATGRTHPAFYSLPEQWESWTQQLNRLQRQQAYVRTADDAVYHIKTVSFPDPPVSKQRLAELEEFYLDKHFLSPSMDLPHAARTAQPTQLHRVEPL